ncbi:MAG: hypothetical protein GKR96_05075 [Gammaproteobacteria bacterium]|nr:hypothetical protein [Gammaproteobacteria bacterium]
MILDSRQQPDSKPIKHKIRPQMKRGFSATMRKYFGLMEMMRISWLLLLGIIFWQAVTPGPADVTQVVNDKLGHFLVFFVMAVWGLVVWRSTYPEYKVVVFLVLFGIVIECVQYFVPMRSFSIPDWGADIVGVLFGLFLYERLWKKRIP